MMNWSLIRIVVVFVFAGVLYGFAKKNHNQREIGEINVYFDDAQALFIDAETIEGLLKENMSDSLNFSKYMLDLNELEQLLNQNQMIASADIYSDIDGRLGVSVVQREPIARFYDGNFQYLDTNGGFMPLSDLYSARVPLVSGFSEEEISIIYPLLRTFYKDEFLKKHIIALRKKNGKQQIELSVRNQDYTIDFGTTAHIDLKISNYKAFYLKAKKENKLKDYKTINLQFGNQVVCTLKQ